MNVHVPQSEKARAEARYVMAVKNMIVSAQSNKPVMGVIQDSLLGAVQLTREDTVLTKSQFFQARGGNSISLILVAPSVTKLRGRKKRSP